MKLSDQIVPQVNLYVIILSSCKTITQINTYTYTYKSKQAWLAADGAFLSVTEHRRCFIKTCILPAVPQPVILTLPTHTRVYREDSQPLPSDFPFGCGPV